MIDVGDDTEISDFLTVHGFEKTLHSFSDGGFVSCLLCCAELHFLNYLLVSFWILGLDVVEKLAALAYHLEEAAAAVVILLMRLEVLRKMSDALREDSNLHEGGTRIFCVLLIILHEPFFFCPLHSKEEKCVKRV